MSSRAPEFPRLIILLSVIGLTVSPMAAGQLTTQYVAYAEPIEAQITFQPSIVPLELTSVALTAFPATVPPATPIPTARGDAALAAAPTAMDSAAALELCGPALAWGDQTLGMCLAPGGSSYLMWTSEDNVTQVMVDPTDPNQLGFQQAASARAAALEEVRTQWRSAIFEGIGFLVASIAFIPACATGVGCAIDGAALIVTGGLLAESGSSIATNTRAFDTATAQATYFSCRTMGGSDSQCRDAAGLSD
jgi:hypothetical protein